MVVWQPMIRGESLANPYRSCKLTVIATAVRGAADSLLADFGGGKAERVVSRGHARSSMSISHGAVCTICCTFFHG